MPNKIPLIVNQFDGLIEELPVGDNLDLGNGQVVNASGISTTFVSSGNMSASGNVTASYFIGDGSYIANLPAGNYSNSNVSDFLPTNSSNIRANNLIALAVITGNSIQLTGNATASYFIGNGSQLTDITAVTSNIAVTVTGNSQPNVTSVGTLTSLSVSGNITSDDNFIGNGQYLTNITGANVTGIVPNSSSVTSNAQPNITSVGTLTSLSVSGNAASGNFIGNGQYLTNITGANVTGNVATANTATTVTSNLQPNITQVGTLGSLSVGNSVQIGNNLNVTNNASITGNLVVGGNINIPGNINQISGNNGQFFGDANGFGALYTGISSGWANIPATVIQGSANYNEYAEFNLQNINSGNKASADYVVTSDAGTNTTYYADLGITSSTWNGSSANNIGNVIQALDVYLYAKGGSLGYGGNLVIAAPSANTSIKFAVGGGNTNNLIANITTTGIMVTGAVSATGTVSGSTFSGAGTGLTGTAASLTAGAVTSVTSGQVTTALGYTPAPQTSGSSILYGNGTGGFSNVTIGGGLNFSAGTLSATAAAPSIPAGSVTTFYQSAAPTGWTQNTSYNDYAVRIVSGVGGSTGGSTAFSSVFTTQYPAGSVSITGISGSVGYTSLDVSQIPSHNHSASGSDGGHSHGTSDPGHSHSFSGSGSTSQTDINHSHDFGATSSGESANHTHEATFLRTGTGSGPWAYGTGGGRMGYEVDSTSGISVGHTHNVNGTTGGMNSGNPHAHNFSVGGGTSASATGLGINTGYASISVSVGATGSGAAHNHSLSGVTGTGSFTGSGMNFNVRYLNMILCTKN